MQNIVRIIDHDIIYIEKLGDQTAESMIGLFNKMSSLSIDLRAQDKPVLILSNPTDERTMSPETRKIAEGMGKNLDFDRSATYGSSKYMEALRDKLIEKADLTGKVANFESREEALAWLNRR